LGFVTPARAAAEQLKRIEATSRARKTGTVTALKAMLCHHRFIKQSVNPMQQNPSSFAATVALVFSLATSLAWSAPPAVGDAPPALLGTDVEGQAVDLSRYAGKAVVVSFWATWCPYCLKELPILEGIQKTAGKERMQVIMVNTESREVFRKSARIMKDLSLQLAHDSDKRASEAYGVNGIPHMVIVGRNGKILRVHRGYDESNLDAIVADINRALAVPQ
jgi:thiol-disulfide isomerase/thioredoxin